MRKLIGAALVISACTPAIAAAQDYYARVQINAGKSAGETDPGDSDQPKGDFRKIPTIASVPNATASLPGGSVSVATHLRGIKCLDIKTGALAENPSACDQLPNPSNVGYLKIPGTANAGLRKLYFDSNRLLEIAPTLTNVPELCSSGTTNVSGNQWRLTCDLSDLNVDYIRVAGSVRPSTSTSPSVLSSGLVEIDTRTGVKCWDVRANNLSVDQGACDYLAYPTDISLNYKIPAQSSANLRAIAINRGDVESISRIAELNPSSIEALCAGSTTKIGTLNYTITCDPENVREHYEWVIGGVEVAHYSYNSATDIKNGTLALDMDVGRICRDTDTNSPATESSKCRYFPKPKEMIVSYHIPANWSSKLRKVLIDLTYFNSIPNISENALSAAAELCGQTFRTHGKGDYTVVCDSEELREHYEWVIGGVEVAHYSYNSATDIKNGTLALDMDVGRICRDTDTDAPATDSSKCQYLPKPKEMTVSYHIPANWSSKLRKVLIDLTYFNSIPNISENALSAAANLCGQTFRVNGVGDHTVACNPEELREHYEWVIGGVQLASRAHHSNSDVKAGQLAVNMTINATCWDTDIDGPAADQTQCSYFPKPLQMSSAYNIPATWDTNLREVLIDPAYFDDIPKISEIAPSAPASLCGQTFSTSDMGDYTVVCN